MCLIASCLADLRRVAVVTFNDAATLQFGLASTTTKSDVKARVAAIQHPGGNLGTATGRAFRAVANSVLQTAAGFRGGRAVVIVITNDNSAEVPSDFDAGRTRLVSAGASIFAVGFGPGVTAVGGSSVRDLASMITSDGRFYTAATASGLAALAGSVASDAVCAGIPTEPPWPCALPPADVVFALDTSGDTAPVFSSIKALASAIVDQAVVWPLAVRCASCMLA